MQYLSDYIILSQISDSDAGDWYLAGEKNTLISDPNPLANSKMDKIYDEFKCSNAFRNR